MSIALKLEIMDLEAELASAPPRERPAIQKRLDGHRAALADAQERGSASRAAARAAARVVVVATDDPEAPAADVEARTCGECGEDADPEDKFCAKCGAELDEDDEPSPEATRAVIDRAVYGYAALKNGKPIKPGDLSTFARSMAMRTAATRDADAVRVRAQIDARKR